MVTEEELKTIKKPAETVKVDELTQEVATPEEIEGTVIDEDPFSEE